MRIPKDSKGVDPIPGIMKEIIEDKVLQQHSFRGIKRLDNINIRFDKYINFLGSVYDMFIYAKDVLKRVKENDVPSVEDIEAKISKYMRYAKEREIKKSTKDNKKGNKENNGETGQENVSDVP